ncbi:MAG TPA: hypothetical protein DER10_00870 [Elusimicrobia bacterium]|nr:MAG: hypothetical protein A2X33_06345 [Elusimicrobia bacterium GWA2_51_34]HAF95706.1 hypothetical protein [Elusimicrobiota bacterium]HCE97029.1 hypothetical protein [Elusimicrobiota bacterium]
MKSINSKTAAAFAMACVMALPAYLAASDTDIGDEIYRDLSMKIVRYANAGNINRIIIAGFTAEGGVEKREAEYISEKITAQLGDQTTPALIERSSFERVLLEARASSAANSSPATRKKFQDLLSVDAVVTGAVLTTGGKLKIQARLVDIKTGKVLFMTEGEAGREWVKSSETRTASRWGGDYSSNPELPGILVADSPTNRDAASQPSRPADFRNAVSDSQKKSRPD